MPDLRQTRKSIKTALAIMLGVDLVAAVVLFSPLVGSTSSRKQELDELWIELRTKTKQLEPLANLPQKVLIAHDQIGEFYKKRVPTQESQIATEVGKLASGSGISIEAVKYKVVDTELSGLQRVEMEADLSGNYVGLAKFINALERDDVFFIINSVKLGGEQQGPVKLNMKLETYLKAGS